MPANLILIRKKKELNDYIEQNWQGPPELKESRFAEAERMLRNQFTSDPSLPLAIRKSTEIFKQNLDQNGFSGLMQWQYERKQDSAFVLACQEATKEEGLALHHHGGLYTLGYENILPDAFNAWLCGIISTYDLIYIVSIITTFEEKKLYRMKEEAALTENDITFYPILDKERKKFTDKGVAHFIYPLQREIFYYENGNEQTFSGNYMYMQPFIYQNFPFYQLDIAVMPLSTYEIVYQIYYILSAIDLARNTEDKKVNYLNKSDLDEILQKLIGVAIKRVTEYKLESLKYILESIINEPCDTKSKTFDELNFSSINQQKAYELHSRRIKQQKAQERAIELLKVKLKDFNERLYDKMIGRNDSLARNFFVKYYHTIFSTVINPKGEVFLPVRSPVLFAYITQSDHDNNHYNVYPGVVLGTSDFDDLYEIAQVKQHPSIKNKLELMASRVVELACANTPSSSKADAFVSLPCSMLNHDFFYHLLLIFSFKKNIYDMYMLQATILRQFGVAAENNDGYLFRLDDFAGLMDMFDLNHLIQQDKLIPHNSIKHTCLLAWIGVLAINENTPKYAATLAVFINSSAESDKRVSVIKMQDMLNAFLLDFKNYPTTNFLVKTKISIIKFLILPKITKLHPNCEKNFSLLMDFAHRQPDNFANAISITIVNNKTVLTLFAIPIPSEGKEPEKEWTLFLKTVFESSEELQKKVGLLGVCEKQIETKYITSPAPASHCKCTIL